MHILLFHDSLLPPKHYGGIERIVVYLSQAYRARGHKVSVLCRPGSKLDGVQIVELPANFSERAQRQPLDEFIPGDIDFIHSHQPLAVEPRKPYLVTIHGNGHPGEHYWPNTNFLSESHARNHGSNIWVFNGVDTQRYPFEPNKDDYFLFLARTTWRVKNLKTALAWARATKSHLKIIGGRGLSRGPIEYLGFTNDDIKVKTLKKAKALIYPTNWDEPCAGAPLEALACGTPVITSPNGCMPEMVGLEQKTGVICRNYRELLAATQKIHDTEPRACRAAAETRFSAERMAVDYLALMDRICKNKYLVPLDQAPKYSFNPKSVTYLYKPTAKNRLMLALRGKI